MKKAIILTFGVLIFISTFSLSGAEILYFENFDDGNLADWTHIPSYNGNIFGIWSVVDGALRIDISSGGDAQNFKLDTLILPDSYVIEFDTRTIFDYPAAASLIGFYTHWTNWLNWVGCGYRTQHHYIEELLDGTKPQRYDVFPSIIADPNDWHHFKYVKAGDWVSLYYDDILIYEIFFPISLTAGYFVFAGARDGIHEFDNLVIKTIEPSIDSILYFYDASVADGTLEGDGPGNSANGRLNALRNMLEMAGDLIAIGDIEGSCGQLRAASRKCDGEHKPPDFVQGEAADGLYNMILELMAELGCE